MITRIMLLLATSFVLSGCTIFGPSGDSSMSALLVPGTQSKCSNARLRFYVTNSYLWVRPRNKCVERGETVEARIVGRRGYTPGIGDIEMDGVEAWLDETNNANRIRITFTVPNTATVGTDYKYELKVAGVGTLDPVVRVRR